MSPINVSIQKNSAGVSGKLGAKRRGWSICAAICVGLRRGVPTLVEAIVTDRSWYAQTEGSLLAYEWATWAGVASVGDIYGTVRWLDA